MGSEPRVWWKNVYCTRDGRQIIGLSMESRGAAQFVTTLMGSTKTIGRWKITLKEPRHA